MHTETSPYYDQLLIFVDDGIGGFIRLDDHFDGLAPTIEKLEFADGSTWDLTGGLNFKGDALNNRLDGTLYDDTFDGAAGNDRIYGGQGDDLYRFTGSSFGYDVVGEDIEGTDTVHLRQLTLARVNLMRDGVDLLVNESRGRAQVEIQGQYDADGPSIEKLLLFDGTTLDLTAGQTFRGTAIGERLVGTTASDTLIGSGGNDRLEGGDGRDSYVFARGWGSDIVVDSSGISYILFDGLAKTQVSFVDQGNDRIYFRTGSEDQVRLVGFNSTSDYKIKYVDSGFSKTTFGSTGNDILRDVGGGDVVSGAGGHDIFLFKRVSDSPESNPDTILDFGSGDKIDLASLDIDDGPDKAYFSTFLGDGAVTGTVGELRFDRDERRLEGDADGDGEMDLAILIPKASGLDIDDLILT